MVKNQSFHLYCPTNFISLLYKLLSSVFWNSEQIRIKHLILYK